MDYHSTRFQKLLDPQKSQLAESFENMARALGRSEQTHRIQFHVLDDARELSWRIRSDREGSRVDADREETADLEITVSSEAWLEIARGTLAPFEAIRLGKMQVIGDIEIGKWMLRRLAPGGEPDSMRGPMGWVTGRVIALHVREDYCKAVIKKERDGSAICIVWGTPEEFANNRVMNLTFLSMLREAFANQSSIRVRLEVGAILNAIEFGGGPGAVAVPAEASEAG